MSNFTKRERALRESIRKLNGDFSSTSGNSIPSGITIKNIIVISGRLLQGKCDSDNCIVLYRTSPHGKWYIFHNSPLTEEDYYPILNALKSVREQEEMQELQQENNDPFVNY